jgi:hypothetical protein
MAKHMTSDAISLEYVCARWAYSELLSAQPYYGSELSPLREKLAQGVPFDELDSVERALLLCKWRQVRGDPAVVRRLRGVAAFRRSAWTKEQLGAAYVMTYFAQQVSQNPLIDRVTFKRWIDAEPIGLPPPGHARYAAEGPAPPIIDRAGIVGRWGDRIYLLDGYRRAVRFWKTQPSDATFEVCVPLAEE